MTDPKLIEDVARALREQMETWADDFTPSSVMRDKGLIWLEGWFDLSAALSPIIEERDRLRDALQKISAEYEGYLSHVDYRVRAKQWADEALGSKP